MGLRPSRIHDINKDQYLDFGGANQVSASQSKNGYTHSQSTGNPHNTEASDIPTENSGETIQDKLNSLESDISNATVPESLEVNSLLSFIKGGTNPKTFVDTLVDEYINEDGVDIGASSGQVYDNDNSLYTNTGSINVNTKLLYHLNGVDGATSTTDASGQSHTPTFNGNAQLDTAQKMFGTASLLLDGDDYLSLADNADFNLSNGNWTFDCWIRFNTLPSQNATTILRQTSADGQFSLHINNGGAGGTNSLAISAVNTGDNNVIGLFTDDITFSTGIWYHFAFVRNGSNCLIFVDGISQNLTGTQPSTSTLDDYDGSIQIGSRSDLNRGIDGWIDEFNFIKGTALYTSNFTPSTTPYGSTTNLILIENNTTAFYTPTSARFIILEKDIDSITLNTDLKGWVSRDDGTTYSQVTLTYVGDFVGGSETYKILTGTVDISGQPSGTDMVSKITSHNSKELKLKTSILYWKP